MSISDIHPMLTVKNLLTALTAVASLTLAIFVFDAERVINKQDLMDDNAAKMQSAVTLLTTTVERHERMLDIQAVKITDLDKRTTVLETVADESHTDHDKRMDREHLPR